MPRPIVSASVRAACYLALLYREMGRSADAGAAAVDYIDRKEGWAPASRTDDFGMDYDPTPLLAGLALEAGTWPRDRATRVRDSWIAEWVAREPGFYKGYLWHYGLAAFARNPEDARAALEAKVNWTLPPYFGKTFFGDDEGRVELLAGDSEHAVAHLERAVRSCRVLLQPIEHTLASYHLGLAYEAQHDGARACTAYATVLARWGAAKPRSITAEAARARVRALACSP